MKKRRTGLVDIANIVGVSKMTVSRFLRDPSSVSNKYRTKISNEVARLGYIPNKAPNMLSNSKSYVIGVLVPSLRNQVFADVLNGIECVMDENGYHTMLAHTSYDIEKEENQIRSLLSYNIDGIIMSERSHTKTTIEMLKNIGIPAVELMDSSLPCLDMAVGINTYDATQKMIAKMLEKGYERIVYLSARQDDRTILRQKAYEDIMRDNGLPFKTIATKESSSYSLGKQLLYKAITEDPATDGVLCTNDDLAIGALLECRALGLEVPKQIAIAGFHGHEIGQAFIPKLASVLTPRYEMGKIAAKLLLKRINGEDVSEPIVELPVSILSGGTI